MDKQAFMKELEYRLRHLTDDDKLDALEYYNEYIEDLNLPPDGDVCLHLGTPKEVARQIIAQTTERKAEEQQEKKTAKGFGSVLWLAILGIFASPIALPLAIAAVVVIIAILFTIGSVVIAFGASGLACAFGGAAFSVLAFTAAGFAQKFAALGIGLFVCGLGILFLIGTVQLSRLTVKTISGIIRKAASRHSGRKFQEA